MYELSTSYNFRRPITQLRLYPGLSQLNMIVFLIYKLKSLVFYQMWTLMNTIKVMTLLTINLYDGWQKRRWEEKHII